MVVDALFCVEEVRVCIVTAGMVDSDMRGLRVPDNTSEDAFRLALTLMTVLPSVDLLSSLWAECVVRFIASDWCAGAPTVSLVDKASDLAAESIAFL